MRWHHYAFVFVLAGCGRSGAASDPPLEGSGSATKLAPDSATIDLPGDAHGAWWDAASRRLYLVDDTHDVLVHWSDAEGFQRLATLPTEQAFGGIARLADGRFAIAAFGFGTHGRVYLVSTDGKIETVENLDPARRRTGLTVAADGVAYVTYFVVEPGRPPRGGIARLDPDTGETDLLVDRDALAKPVGLAATSSTIYATDQNRGTIHAYDRHSLAMRIVAKLREPDLIAALPDGTLIVGSRNGSVHRITDNGAAIVLASGLEEVRGTAYDAERERLFVVEHSASSSRHRLHILPVEL